MPSASYQARRDEIENYFDQTASAAWAALTSDAPVSRIRRTVRRGRDAMRATLLSWLPDDLRGCTLLDAGCGTAHLNILLIVRCLVLQDKAEYFGSSGTA